MASPSSGGQRGPGVEFCGHAAWSESDKNLGVSSDRVGPRQKGRIEFGAPCFVELVAGRQDLQRPAKERVCILDKGQVSRGVT